MKAEYSLLFILYSIINYLLFWRKSMYGLTEKEFYKIINTLKFYSKEIEWVKIFGSRARGDYKKNFRYRP